MSIREYILEQHQLVIYSDDNYSMSFYITFPNGTVYDETWRINPFIIRRFKLILSHDPGTAYQWLKKKLSPNDLIRSERV